MNEEEKKAIEVLFYCLDKPFGGFDKYYFNDDTSMMIFEAVRIVLDLVAKQQKENKEIRQWKYVIDTYEDLDKLKELDLIKIKGKEYISKDKIREKIEELEKQCESELLTTWLEAKIEVLQELLEE